MVEAARRLRQRRYDTLTDRIHEHLSCAAALGVSTHWIRHTTLTWVEREFGMAVARAFAGHSDRPARGVSTFTNVGASVAELAEAVSVLTGDPLARSARPSRQAPTEAARTHRQP